MSRISSKSERSTKRIICLTWSKITMKTKRAPLHLLSRTLAKVPWARHFVMPTTKVSCKLLLLIRRTTSCRPYLPTTPMRKHLSNFRTIRWNPILRTCSRNKVARGHFSLCWITSTENTTSLLARLHSARTLIRSRSKIIVQMRQKCLKWPSRMSHPWSRIQCPRAKTLWRLSTTRRWFLREIRR